MRGYTEALWWTDGTSPSTHERESLNSWLLGFWSPEVWSLTLVDWWTLADDFVSQITSYASNSCVMLFFEKCKLKPFSPWNSSLKTPTHLQNPNQPQFWALTRQCRALKNNVGILKIVNLQPCLLINSFTMNLLPGEFPPLTWPPHSHCRRSYFWHFSILFYQHVENGRSVIFGVIRNSNAGTNWTKWF